MKRLNILQKTILSVLLAIPLCLNAQYYCDSNPVSVHGKLSVNGNKIVDKNNNTVSFAGGSLFWSNTGWGGEDYYTSGVVSWLEQDWDATIVRAAMGVEDNGGYLSDPNGNKNRVKTVVDAAISNGLYVIIDWHSHNAQNYESQAIDFFREMAQTYGDYPNVIYEIYNEPLQISWSGTIKPYAEAVISAIREIDSDNLIVVGTPTWSQDVDVASNDPITGYSNIAYALHFYAGTHGSYNRQKAQTALNNGIALMVTEWGTVNANGDGGVNYGGTDEWMSFLANNDITHLNWAVNDKSEGASALKPGSSTNGGWSSGDLTESGVKVKSIINNWEEYCSGNNGSNNPPSVSITSPSNNSSYNQGTSISIGANASDSDGSVSSVQFFVNGSSIGGDSSSPYSKSWTPSSPGSYTITAVAEDNDGSSTTSSAVSITVNGGGNGGGSAYPDGNPHNIPGTINPTHYDTGGQGVSYYDNTSGNEGAGIRQNENVDTEYKASGGNVGWIASGEWLEFTVDVQNSGTYNIAYEVASQNGSGQFKLEFNGQNKTGNVNVPSTGDWGNFTTITSQNVNLSSGEQTMRLYFTEGPFNIGNITFQSVNNPPSNVDVTGVSVNPSNLTLDKGDKATINASVSPGNASNKSVSWSSSNNNVATVNNSGVVTAVNEGSATITVKTSDGGYTANTQVTVKDDGNPPNNGCNLPWTDSNFTISDETKNYSSGNIDISCENQVCISMDIEGVGNMESSDYLNVYYKVNGGSQKVISENVDAFSKKTISVCGVSGNNVEIIIQGKTSVGSETYYIQNIKISEDDDNDDNNGGTQNLALSGNASQSSTAHGGVASRAIDNNTNGNWGGGSITHTQDQNQPWWQVKLQQDSNIEQIKIFNRTNSCCVSRLSNFTVSVLNNNGSVVWSKSYSNPPTPSLTINLNEEGRTVKVNLNGSNPLSLAEVQVFGTANNKLEQTQDINLSVYPNPFTRHLTVELPADIDSDVMILQLMNVDGKVIYQQEQLSTGQIIQISEDIPSGVYFLRWTDEKNRLFSTQKVVKYDLK